MSKKYIEADELIEHIEIASNYRGYQIKHALQDVNDFPAADVRENVRGEWLFREDTETDMLECSNCGCRAIREPYEHALGTNGFKFCPYCGADMRGEEHTMEEYMMGQEGNPDDGSL